jgi:hypothetical protein
MTAVVSHLEDDGYKCFYKTDDNLLSDEMDQP